METPLVIFYHIYAVNNYREIVNDQISKVLFSGLYNRCYKMYIGVIGELSEFEFLKNSFSHPMYSRMNFIHFTENFEERSTLKLIQSYSDNPFNNPDTQIFYFHTKGVSKPSTLNTMWRTHADAHNILKWEYHLEALLFYDVSGINLRTNTWMGYYPHYSNNYWWTTSNYIKTLNTNYLTDTNRFMGEFWIGSSNVKGACLFSENSFYQNSAADKDMTVEDFFISNYVKNTSHYITL